MQQIETKALIIKGTNYGESDRIMVLITEDLGNIKGIAKGARKSLKRFGGALEPFTLTKLLIKEGKGELCYINDAKVVNTFKSIKSDIEKISYGSYILELADALSVEDNDPVSETNKVFFALLLSSLEKLDSSKEPQVVVREFEIRVLSLTGYMPSLVECTSCGNNIFHAKGKSEVFHETAFSQSRGGVVCEGCRGHEKSAFDFVSPGTLKTLSNVLSGRVSFTKHALDESGVLLGRFISQHIGKRLKSLDFIEHMKGI